MKCPKCGANLSIDDEKCPFCGAANPFAVKHRKEMHRFKREFQKTKEEVLHKSNYFNQWTVKITLIAVLAALNLALLLGIRNSYKIDNFFQEMKINANIEEYRQQLDSLLKEGNYIAFSAFWDDYSLYYSDELDQYSRLASACRDFASLYDYTLDIVVKEDGEYISHQHYMESAAENIDYIYNSLENAKEYPDDWDLPGTVVYLEEMTEKMEDLVQTYYGLTDEERESFSTLSKTQRQVLMEEGIEQYE